MNSQIKTAIVTGGGRDIGRACVLALAESGMNVAINYHSSSEGADSAVAIIIANGGQAFAMQGDMTQKADVDALIAATLQRFSSIDTLVHVTGGIVARKNLAELDLAHINTVMALNFSSFFLTAQACVPHMSSGSNIVALASQAGRDGGGPGAGIYAASKGAIITYVRGLAKELGPDIRVNSVCPGMIDTDFHNIFTKDEVRKHVANITPLKREGSSEEVAELVSFLASDKASFMTGTNIDINGGLMFS